MNPTRQVSPGGRPGLGTQGAEGAGRTAADPELAGMRREGGQEGRPCISPVNCAQVPVCPVQGAKGTQIPGDPGTATGLKDLTLCGA